MSREQIAALLVDDEASFRRALRTSLCANGYDAEEAATGEQALEILQQRTFDVVLLDINMPGMGGVETCRAIRNQLDGIGIVMVSVRDGESDLVKALEAGADDYVIKPVRFRELLARIGAVLRRLHPETPKEDAVMRVGELELDLNRRELRRNGEPIHLTPTEFPAFSADAESGFSSDTRQAVALNLGARVRDRTGLLALIRQGLAKKN
jgi:two-component system, OmpR family, KDP operon response regulator KdpE